jgi:hypothetical protein
MPVSNAVLGSHFKETRIWTSNSQRVLALARTSNSHNTQAQKPNKVRTQNGRADAKADGYSVTISNQAGWLSVHLDSPTPTPQKIHLASQQPCPPVRCSGGTRKRVSVSSSPMRVVTTCSATLAGSYTVRAACATAINAASRSHSMTARAKIVP